MSNFEFRQIDVFTSKPLSGNPLAVVLDADHLDETMMQRVAVEMNLSETAFVLKPTTPDADYRLRIFTPKRELPFAGHPSVGTAFVLFQEGRFGDICEGITVHQEVGIGILPIEISPPSDEPLIMMTQGEPVGLGNIENIDRLSECLECRLGDLSYSQLQPRISSTGLRQLMVPLGHPEILSSLTPNLTMLAGLERDLDITGVCVFAFENPTSVRVRFFSPESGIPEDPATGSAAGALGAYLAAQGALEVTDGRARMTVSQGVEINRPSLIEVAVGVNGTVPAWVKIGGHCVSVLKGKLSI